MPPKGKQGTKGKKQIIEENKSTLQFYQYIILGVNGVFWTLQYFLFWENFTALPMVLSVLAILTCLGSYKFLSSMAGVTKSADGSVIDGGIDLNMESGMAEHAKDMIIFTSAVQTMTLITANFWFLILVVPGRAFYLLWVNFLGPWIFAPPPEVDEKKEKKKERKMMRRH